MHKLQIDKQNQLSAFKPCQIYTDSAKERPTSVPSSITVQVAQKEEWTVFIDEKLTDLFEKDQTPKFSIVDQRFVYSLAIYSTPSSILSYINEKLTSYMPKIMEKFGSSKDTNSFIALIKNIQLKFSYLQFTFSSLLPNQESFYNILINGLIFGETEIKFFVGFITGILEKLFKDSNEEDIRALITYMKDTKLLEVHGEKIFTDIFTKLSKELSAVEIYQAFRILYTVAGNDIETMVLYNIASMFAKDFVANISSQPDLINADPVNTNILAIIFKSLSTISESYRKFTDFITKNSKDALKDDKLFENFIKFQSQLLSLEHIGQVGRNNLTRVLERQIGATSEQVTRLLASEVSRIADIGPSAVTDDAIEAISNAFAWMGNTKLFEELYIADLVKRLIENKDIQADCLLAQRIESLVPELATKIIYILEDFKQNKDAVQEFTKKYPAQFNLSFSIIQSYILKNEQNLNVKPPEEVLKAMTEFTKYYTDKVNKRALNWHAGLSRCNLEVKNCGSLRKVRCDGIVASILTVIGEGKQEEELVELVGLEKPKLEEILTALSSSKYGSLITKTKSTYKVNVDCKPDENGIIDIPTISEKTPTSQVFESKESYASRESQIDAAITRALKGGGPMTEKDLISVVQKEVEFPVSEDLFQRRLKILITRQFLEREGAKIAYLP
ncbi:hypothetical protein TVAG_475770 [Trichomonas vaginalis G3]|uniref:Cullin family profile domain-containing protein n=1 Tax=Trichomonas vaginalis (strain ATCC PRA-98 / G3) TaxID=412133 RepID=A2DA01_TRIV3|nr:ubiquitin protein ligase binding [Trichomonas vaginalis G3]EAY22649.1 hypothetical protein TVAG_475770 [Trichomonas vaginalis G3]KAI5525463.1 ubiquitin protein ligase binding [Trichomonas vaginalis G3]|eukprot:XP_001583635.1 hypothetical protein [Trichomonas vaginalis G3]